RVEEHMLDHRADRDLTDFLKALAIIEVEIARVAGVDHQPGRARVSGAPVVQRLEQLLAVTLAMELGMYDQQRQHVKGTRRQATQNRRVVLEITPGVTETRSQQHAQTPGPALRDIQPTLRWRDQRHTDQPILNEQTQCRLILQEVL